MSLLRIYIGVGLFVKAISFVANRDALVQMMVDRNVLFGGIALAHVVIVTHLVGGALMALGWKTRFGALIQVPNLIGAVFLVNWAGGVLGFAEELRFSALVLFILLLFVWYGSGPLSVDERIGARSGSPAT
jgi:uncharacterized membrane protein YphA (DoxX/SURF4 family)